MHTTGALHALLPCVRMANVCLEGATRLSEQEDD
jgi:hypothetical protein